MSVDSQTILGAAFAIFAIAAALAVIYWPQTSVELAALLRAADRESYGLQESQKLELRRRANRFALDVSDGKITLGAALQQIACDAALMRRVGLMG